MNNKYRRCVGMMIINDQKNILVGKRIDHPSGYWQMPQGGIDENENPEEAVWREMMEEVGTNEVELISTSSKWFTYNIPKDTLKTLPWGEKYIGQTQKWFVFRLIGDDSKINIETENPEFSEWKWANFDSIADSIVPFKREVYKKVLNEFKKLFN